MTNKAIQAVWDDDCETLKSLLSSGVNVNTWDDENDMTLLMIAAKEGYDDIVRLLLEHHADVNACDTYETTAFDFACQNGHVTIAQLLLSHRVIVTSNSLVNACAYGCTDVVKMLLDRGADVNECNLITYACKYGNIDTVKLLLEYGANIDDALIAAKERPNILRLLSVK